MNVLALFKQVRTLIFDVDGVLTDGSLLLFENGIQARKMNIKDGLALQMATKNDFRLIIISGADSKPVLDRFHYLGLTEVFLGVKDKKQFLDEYFSEHALSWQQTLYMGDDLPDIAPMSACFLPCCPADAVPEIKQICKYISPARGGAGCARDVIEKVLKLNNKWNYTTQIASR